MGEKYIAMVEADAGLAVMAESAEEADAKLENANTGVLGPPEVGPVEKFDGDDE